MPLPAWKAASCRRLSERGSPSGLVPRHERFQINLKSIEKRGILETIQAPDTKVPELFIRALNMPDTLSIARKVISDEILALKTMSSRLDETFTRAVKLILNSRGRVILVGMGKSGIIGRKIAASLASTGTPSFSVHPGEAFHGDLGMIRPEDVVIMISNSGETEELLRLLPFLEHQNNPIIAMTGRIDSTLARNADAVLDVSVEKEACANNLAPTSSTTAALVMGDALTIAVSSRRGFRPEDFARFHPGGSLGRKLLARVKDVMRKDRLPVCTPQAPFRDVVHQITEGRLGLVVVMENNALCGVITDGDVRRVLDTDGDVRTLKAADLMTREPITITADARLSEAEARMLERKVSSLVVTDAEGALAGVLQIFD